jgi:hypothetical protein
MSLVEATNASKLTIRSQGKQESECEFAAPVNGPDGLGFWLVEGRIAAVQVQGGTNSTAFGIRIGDADQKVLDAYKGKMATPPKPKSSDDARIFRIISKGSSGVSLEMNFFSWGGKIGMMVAGRPFIDKPGQRCQYKGASVSSVTDLEGKWSGMTSDHYPVEVTVQGKAVTIAYPSLRCSGSLEVLKTDQDVSWYREHITSGKNLCYDGGSIQLKRNNAGNSSILSWRYEAMGKAIEAQLRRSGEDTPENQEIGAQTKPADQNVPINYPVAEAQTQLPIASTNSVAKQPIVAPTTQNAQPKSVPATDCSKLSGFFAQAQCLANMASKIGIVK